MSNSVRSFIPMNVIKQYIILIGFKSIYIFEIQEKNRNSTVKKSRIPIVSLFPMLYVRISYYYYYIAVMVRTKEWWQV